jgi:heavy metal sensor kinase
MWFGNTVRWRLTLWYMFVLFLSFLCFGFGVDHLVKKNLYSQVDRQLLDTISGVASALDRTYREETDPTAARLLDEIDELGLPSQLVLQLTTGAQKLLVNTRSLPEALSAAVAGGRISPGIPATVDSTAHSWRLCTVAGGRGAGYQVLLARDLAPIHSQMGSFRRALFIAIPLILLLAAASGYFLAGRALNPVNRITAQARLIGAQGLDERLEVGISRDEFGELAHVLNDLFARLDQAFQQQRQFLSDAAHELRTPAAILRSQADVTLAQPRSAPEYEAALASIRSETEHLSAIVDDLLLIARAEASQLPVVRERADLMEIVDDCCRAMRPLLQCKGILLNWTIGEEVALTGDIRLLRRAILNLLANAIQYAPAQGRISVTVRAVGERASVEIADSGPGIAAEDLPHIFKRFYRSARRSGSESGGAGLGLPIAKMISEMHGGSIEASNHSGGGTIFRLLLPTSYIGSVEAAQPK